MTQPIREGIYGASGAGKTTLARWLIRDLRRVIVFDPVSEWSELPGFRAATSLEDLAGHIASNFRIAYVPTVGNEPEELHKVSLFVRELQSREGGRITLVADELNTAFPSQMQPAHIRGFAELCSRGRHYGVNLIGIAQRVSEVNTRWRGNETGRYVLRLADFRDIQVIAAQLVPEQRLILRDIPNFEYVRLSPAGIERGKIKKFPNR